MKQPDIIIGGATRSGLNALQSLLAIHPQIFIPQKKEHLFFHREKIMSQTLESCQTIFEDEVNTEYKNQIPTDRILHTELEFDPEIAHKGAPHAKIIFTLRNPVTRCYAQYHHIKCDKKERAKTFEKAIEFELAGIRTPQNSNQCWIFKNQFQEHLESWLSFYPKRNIFILIHEEWSSPSKLGIKELEQFLSLKKDSLSAARETLEHKDMIEAAPKKQPPMSDETRENLEDIFATDQNFISNYIGRNIEVWNKI